MYKRLLLLLILFASVAAARDKVENWLEVRSPHFVVATTANEKQARRIAEQFERMRSLFHALFPKLKLDPSSPIIVIAIKDDKDFRALEPQEYLAKGSLQLGGLFLRAADKNYVLLRLDAQGEHPYSTIYHEYTHLLMSKAEWMPLWLNEGLAEFYENTDIEENDVILGRASDDDIRLLLQSRLLPMPTLFSVDQNSPYYHEETKGSIFYAESWALTHYLRIKDLEDKKPRLQQYIESLANGTDATTAATTAFGDLKQLEADLNVYIHQPTITSYNTKISIEVDPTSFKVENLSSAQADAIRADFLAYNRRTQDARTLLDHVLHDDPDNVSARETLGLLEFQAGHLDEAKKWYRQAVELNSQSYVAHYYFAAISMQGTIAPSDEKQIENSLRMATKLNPSFAPPFDRLAVFLGSRDGDLREAHMMGLTAVSLDPENMGYRVNVANVLLRMGQGQNAVNVLRIAVKLAKTPEETQFVNEALLNAQTFATAQDEMKAQQQQMREEAEDSEAPSNTTVTSADTTKTPRLARRDAVPNGPHRFLTGVLADVHCDSLKIDLALKSTSKSTNLYADNYFRVRFTTLGFELTDDLKPCAQLEGRPAKVEYIESADKSKAAYLLAIELHK